MYNNDMVKDHIILAKQRKEYIIMGEDLSGWKHWALIKTMGLNSATDVKHNVQL